MQLEATKLRGKNPLTNPSFEAHTRDMTKRPYSAEALEAYLTERFDITKSEAATMVVSMSPQAAKRACREVGIKQL